MKGLSGLVGVLLVVGWASSLSSPPTEFRHDRLLRTSSFGEGSFRKEPPSSPLQRQVKRRTLLGQKALLNRQPKQISLPAKEKTAPKQRAVEVQKLRFEGRWVEAAAGQWLLRLRKGASAADLAQALSSLGATVRQSSLGVVLLRAPRRHSAQKVQQILRNHPLVQKFRPNLICRGVQQARRDILAGVRRSLPPDLKPAYFWFHRVSGLGSWFRERSKSQGQGVIIALLDSGVAYEDRVEGSLLYRKAPALYQSHILPGKDLLARDDHPDDDHQHGTFLATLMVGKLGIAPQATLLPVKVLDQHLVGTELALAEGIHYAARQGAQIINMSLAFPRGYYPSRILQEAVSYALKKGALLVASAGNEGDQAQGEVQYPAALAPVLAVGAAQLAPGGQDVMVAPYSSPGGALDLLAPGGSLQHDHNKDGVPDGIVSQTFATNQPGRFAYWLMAGTSPAAAYVSATAALLLAQLQTATAHPQKSRSPANRKRSAQKDPRSGQQVSLSEQVTTLLLRGAREMGSHGFDARSGHGLLQVDRSLAQAPSRSRRQDPLCLVNLTSVVLKNKAQKRLGLVQVEVLNRRGTPLSGYRVYGRWFGGVAGQVDKKTDRQGRIRVFSKAVQKKRALFGFVVDAVAHQRRGPCRPLSFSWIAQGNLPFLELYRQGKSNHVLLTRLSSTALILSYPSTPYPAQPTTILNNYGTGLLHCAQTLFAEDSYFDQTVQTETWSDPLVDLSISEGVGSKTYPLDFGAGGQSILLLNQPQGQVSGSFYLLLEKVLGSLPAQTTGNKKTSATAYRTGSLLLSSP